MKSILLFILALWNVSVSAQTSTTANPFPKTISVTGSAEIEIIPDEIYVQVDLREYEKKGAPKTDLEKIKTDFFEAARTAGIHDSLISIASYQGYDRFYWWRRKTKKQPELFSSISYQIKFKQTSQMDALIERLDDNATQNFFISRTAHSKIQEYRKQLKIQAIKAAKEKALYLTEAINETLGQAITLEEPEEYYTAPGFSVSSNKALQEAVVRGYDQFQDKDVAQQPNIDFKKIKLRMALKAVFALK